ncbi:amino acid ABC transporter permease [Nocardia sp. NPDC052254]|uniref:amino acid ABC transporter permease n=1 Tax=Nocardia sp. NPDC052254 TaxID=3155681 RepID=UPI0034163E1D
MFDLISRYDSQLWDAFWVTIKLTVFSAVGALIIGTLVAAMRVSPVPVARWMGTTYVTVFRNTPLTLILVFCSLGLYTTLGIELASESSGLDFLPTNNFRFAVLGLSVYTASFVCESLRAGINTVPLGQSEAGRSLGLTFSQNLRHVVLPQAFRSVIAPLGSVLIALTKNSTIASAIGVAEAAALMASMNETEADILAIGAIFALGFVILTLPTGLLFGWLAKRFEVKR